MTSVKQRASTRIGAIFMADVKPFKDEAVPSTPVNDVRTEDATFGQAQGDGTGLPEAVERTPVSLNSGGGIDLTDLTELPISNNDFLRAIFTGLTEPQRPMVVDFPGNPKNGNWAGRPWNLGNADTGKDTNNCYFTLAAYLPRDDGEYHRAEEDCAVVYGVMLDDLEGGGARGAEQVPAVLCDRNVAGKFSGGLPVSRALGRSRGRQRAEPGHSQCRAV
jgi:hypothetical protein